jgi:hypothetical protein
LIILVYEIVAQTEPHVDLNPDEAADLIRYKSSFDLMREIEK